MKNLNKQLLGVLPSNNENNKKELLQYNRQSGILNTEPM